MANGLVARGLWPDINRRFEPAQSASDAVDGSSTGT